MIPFRKLFYRGKDVEKPGEKDILLHGGETGEMVRSSWHMNFLEERGRRLISVQSSYYQRDKMGVE